MGDSSGREVERKEWMDALDGKHKDVDGLQELEKATQVHFALPIISSPG